MINHSAAYDAAITGSSRKIVPLMVFDLVDPDYRLTGHTTNDESPYSITEQAVRRASIEEGNQTIGTFELNRWILDGSITIEPVNKYQRIGHVGWETQSICDNDGYFATDPYLEITFSGVSIVQVMTVRFFEDLRGDGIGEDFTVQLWSDDYLVHTIEVTGNVDENVVLEGFTVYYPTRARITINKWSRGQRRVRLSQFLLGLYEDWDAKNISSVDVYTESTFSGLSLPYSTCSVEVFNKNHRFDPYAPNSIFKSIEDRQAITVKLGTKLEDGTTEWIPCGMYYQQSGGGWKLNDLTIQFNLLDVIGMLTKRNFIVPDTLPTTLSGWIKAIVSSLGVNFTDKYRVDSEVANMPLTATKEDVEGKTCGVILRMACMATNTWPHQDMETGKLWISKIAFTTGNKITLDNMVTYPVMSENGQIADITFQLDKDSDGKVQSVTFPGTNTESEVSLNVSNPFIHSVDDARTALLSCMFAYGGKTFQVTHRGNPTSETGDIQSVDTQFLTTISARLYKQQLKLERGVMRNMPSYLVQSPNDSMYANKKVLTGSGTWTFETTDTVKVTLIAGGNGGQGGGGGVYKHTQILWYDGDTPEREGGAGGPGGKVFVAEFQPNAGQEYDYRCGAGGAGGSGGAVGQDGSLGGAGGNTTFGFFTTENGNIYPNGVMDVQSGTIYGATGANSGDKVTGSYGTGGTGGEQGENGLMVYYRDEYGYHFSHYAKHATPGIAGSPGQPGCIILEW